MKRGIIKYAVIFWSYIAFILLVIMFFLTFLAAKGCIKATAQQKIMADMNMEAEANLLLLNYLRTPVNPLAPDPKTTIADLIVSSIDSKILKSASLEAHTKGIIGEYFKKNYYDCCWEILISQADKDVYRYGEEDCRRELHWKELKVTAAIPAKAPITVDLKVQKTRIDKKVSGMEEYIETCIPK